MVHLAGLLIFGSGVAFSATPLVFTDGYSPVPGWAWYAASATIACFGLLLITRKRNKPARFGDGPLINTLKRSGFSIAPIKDGWQATGTWKNVLVTVQKTTGFEAARFARPWTIVVALPGQPIDPWPLLAEEGLIIEQTEQGFSVACTDLSRSERMHRLGEKLDQLVNYRHAQ
jgi:hypothetical protein